MFVVAVFGPHMLNICQIWFMKPFEMKVCNRENDKD